MIGLDLLRCSCGGTLRRDKNIRCDRCAKTYELRDGVIDFRHDHAYTESFSVQWNKHRQTHVDSRGYQSGYPGEVNSRVSFHRKTMLAPEELRDKIVLDAGCGVGRYAEIVAPHAGLLICVDLSEAVYHCAELLRAQGFKNALCLRADLASLPLANEAVDVAYSIGVIHHTAEPARTLAELRRIVKAGGTFAGWVYAHQPSYDHPRREAFRRFTADPQNWNWVWQLAELAPLLRDLYQADRQTGWPMMMQVLGISSSTNDEECKLDTFDWLTCRYQYQYTEAEFNALLTAAGFATIQNGFVPVNFKATRP